MLEFRSFASSSKGNLHTLDDGETRVMLDCGLPWKQVQEALSFKTSEFSGICLTHVHNDHSVGVIDATKAGHDVYLLPETREALGLSGHRVHEIDLLHQFKIGSFTVMAFPLKHDVPNCGFLFANREGERMIYITDAPFCHYRFNNLQIIAIEANYDRILLKNNTSSPGLRRAILGGHMSIETLRNFLLANDLSQLQETWLLHLSSANSNAEDFKRQIQALTGKPVYIGGET